MIEVNKNSTRTDVAWKRLYSRLNQDNLLPATGEETIHRRLFLKWGRVYRGCLLGIGSVDCTGKQAYRLEFGDTGKSRSIYFGYNS